MLSALYSPEQAVDVQAIMRRIREHIRGGDSEQEWVRRGRKAVPSHLISSVGRLKASTALLRSAVARIGDAPPTPPTLRGRIGLVMVNIVRRGLFWLIPSIQITQTRLVDALEGHLAATEEILRILQQTHTQIARLEKQTSERSGGAAQA